MIKLCTSKSAIINLCFLVACLITAPHSFSQFTQRTNLPTIYLNTNGVEVNSKDFYVPGTLKVIAAGETVGIYDGAMEIRGRGNFTWQLPKKPYKIKLASKVKLLGLPANENKWVLLANYKDNTLLRNPLAFEIGKYMGFAFTPAYRLVDVYLNNTYIGNYTLTDQVERGNNRVTLDKLDNTIKTEPNLSGGYLIQAEIYAEDEPNHWKTPQAMAVAVKYPDDGDLIPEQFDYIKNFLNTYETKLFSAQSLDPVNGYRPMNDRASQVNWFISCELTGNNDSFLSIFMYKQRNDQKLYFGPMWDFDGAFNNAPNLFDATYKRMSSEANGLGFPRQMLKDPEFKAALKTRWNELKTAGIEQAMDAKIVQLAQDIAQSQAANKTLWGYDNPNSIPNYNNKPYSDFVTELRTYMKNRIAYLDQQFNDVIRTDMYYKLYNRTSWKVMDINNTTDQMVVQNTANASATSQQWKFIPVDVSGVTYYKIQNRATGKYLTALTTTNTQLKLTTDAVGENQLYRPQGSDNNAYYGFINKYSGRAAEDQAEQQSDGNPISQGTPPTDAVSRQQWTFVPFEVTGALPVTIFGLEAKADESKVTLSWQVSENVNGEKFVIQRSSDPSKFKPDSIGQIALREGGTGAYEFSDISPRPGLNYYRLKTIDFDGTTEYSRFVKANYAILQNINVYPQPAAGVANISFTSVSNTANSTIEVFNQMGQKVTTLPVQVAKGNNLYKVNTKNYATGLYEIRFNVNDQISTKKLLIISE